MKKIKLFDPSIDKNEERELLKTFQSHNWASGAGGQNVSKFEHKFNNFVGANDCVAVNSGTAALHLALSLYDLKEKEVILPSMSFVSTAHAIKYNGGKPVFADVDPKTLCIDPIEVEKKINEKTVAVLPVHFAGMPCDLDYMKKICRKNKLLLIEDAAHAVGATYKGGRIGSHGDHVCFSFHPVKNLAMPTGGAITLNSKKYKSQKKILASLRWCGISDRVCFDYDVTRLGWNFYMNEFSAAIGLEQLKKLDIMNFKRKKIAKRYSDEIKIENKIPLNDGCVYHLFWIQVKNRKKFMVKMSEKGIETGIHYKPIHQMKYYKNNQILKNTAKAGERIVSIPIHPNLSENEQSFIIKMINSLAE